MLDVDDTRPASPRSFGTVVATSYSFPGCERSGGHTESVRIMLSMADNHPMKSVGYKRQIEMPIRGLCGYGMASTMLAKFKQIDKSSTRAGETTENGSSWRIEYKSRGS